MLDVHAQRNSCPIPLTEVPHGHPVRQKLTLISISVHGYQMSVFAMLPVDENDRVILTDDQFQNFVEFGFGKLPRGTTISYG